MARSPSRRSRGRSEEEAETPARPGRRRGEAPPKGGPGSLPLILGAVVVVLIGVAIAVGMSGPREKVVHEETVRLGPAPARAPEPSGPAEAAPRPLTAEETAEIERLFREAEPHMEAFRRHARAGWDQKGKGNNEAANDAWVEAKHEYLAAVELVAEVLEDYERFPQRRQDAFMKRWNERLASWQKEWGGIPKVNVK